MVVKHSASLANSTHQIEEARIARKRRRFSDDIFVAFHFACDVRDFDVAKNLLNVLEGLLLRNADEPAAIRARELRPLVAAHERLWTLRSTTGVEPPKTFFYPTVVEPDLSRDLTT
jgi:hypothetical protein